MTNSMLWAGPALSLGAESAYPHVSPAAVWWNARLVSSLEALGSPTAVVTHIAEPLWPRGKASHRYRATFADGRQGETVRYLNLPVVRVPSLYLGYLRLAKRQITSSTSHVVAYNPYPYLRSMVARLLRDQEQMRSVFILADDAGVNPKTGVEDIKEVAHLRVCLSWADFLEARESGPALHLDGGIDVTDTKSTPRSTGRPIALYTGALSAHGGVDLLVRSLEYLNREIEVVVCGRGRSRALESALENDDNQGRLRWLGMVNEDELHQLSLHATCFVNPRPDDVGSRHNFPSKILRYLGYRHPVMSTRTLGIAPEYEDVLTFADSDKPHDIARAIEVAVASAGDASAERRRLGFARRRSWERQAQRFLEFIQI